MEQRDVELIERYQMNDKNLEALYREHLDYERQLEKLNNKPYLTPSEEMERKNIQKMKLRGRDEIELILAQYRRQATLS